MQAISTSTEKCSLSRKNTTQELMDPGQILNLYKPKVHHAFLDSSTSFWLPSVRQLNLVLCLDPMRYRNHL